MRQHLAALLADMALIEAAVMTINIAQGNVILALIFFFQSLLSALIAILLVFGKDNRL